MSDLAALSDQQLAFALRTLEAKVHALRDTTTAVGMALYQQFREKLDAVRAELERRQV
jgi:hypothetical protein